jgi:hypothetical protein
VSTHKCRCGTWTNFGLTCTRCQTEALDYIISDGRQEKDSDEVVIEVPLNEYEPEVEEDD